jgi:hypothetical protein
MCKHERLDRQTRTGYGWWGEPWHAKNQDERDKELSGVGLALSRFLLDRWMRFCRSPTVGVTTC